MHGRLGDKVRLQHILSSIDEIEMYVRMQEFSNFSSNSMMRFACIKQLEIIGEAANHLSKETKQQFPHIQWPQIIGLRNILVHEYFGVDAGLVWDIINNDIPVLKDQICDVLSKIE